MTLTNEQQKQIDKQLSAHEHNDYMVDIQLTPEYVLPNFKVDEGVFRPEISVSLELARCLYYNNGLFLGKTVFDIGCGSGLQSIIVASKGHTLNVTASDISKEAIKNTLQNVNQYGLEDEISVIQSDLFENIYGEADVIIFNHPFFPEEPFSDIPISKSMLGGKKLIHRFLDDAKNHLTDKGKIIMPYLYLAGDENSPYLRSAQHGYLANIVYAGQINQLQTGHFAIYELKLK